MALLKLNERKAIFKELGLGEYNEKNIKAFQKKYMLRKSDWDGIYGNNTDNTLRTVYYTKVYCKNFKPEEFRCECGGRYCCGYPNYMKPAELIHIQAIRDHYNEPITVTCGLRCRTWNSKLGGSIQNSLHLQGLAIDFYQSGVTDPLANRKRSIKWIAKQPNHHYTYGNGIYRLTTDKTYSGSVSAPYMGNCLHTDTNNNVEPKHPKWVEPKKNYYKVIDVSDWQGSIDWKKVKADGVVGAIIRYADGTTLDKRFAENMKNAKANGIHVGSYIFSRAKTKAEAEKEATRLYKACKPYALDMPLYIDLEAKGLEKYADTVAIAFLAKMKALGAKGGVYANLNWWNNYLKKTATEHNNNAFWIAQYNDTMDYKPASRMGMWQYSSSGSVNGIQGRVDMNKCYVAYWKAKPKAPTNGEKIASKGWEYAYHTNTKEAAYPSGKPVPAYKAALDTAFGKVRKWQPSARLGASCDVFIATCIRMAGIDKEAPRGLGRSYFDKSDKFKRVSVTASTIQDGDIISIIWSNGKPHWCMAYEGKVLEASLKGYWPKTQSCLKSRLSLNGKQSVVVYRAK